MEADVVGHVDRIIKTAIADTDDVGKLFFSNVRQKRRHHAYRRIIYLEPVLLRDAAHPPEQHDNAKEMVIASPLPVGFTLCCTVLPTHQTPKEKRQAADKWEYEPDDTSLPTELEKRVRDYYRKEGLKIYEPTMKSLTRLINHLWKSGGEARVGIQSLKKMGFSNHAARQHVRRLEDMGIINASGYCPAAAVSKGYKLSKRTMALFNNRLPKERARRDTLPNRVGLCRINPQHGHGLGEPLKDG